MEQMTKIKLAHELLEQELSKIRIAERLQVSRRTVNCWAQAIEQRDGLEAYQECYQQVKRVLAANENVKLLSNAASGHHMKSATSVVARRSSTSCVLVSGRTANEVLFLLLRLLVKWYSWIQTFLEMGLPSPHRHFLQGERCAAASYSGSYR